MTTRILAGWLAGAALAAAQTATPSHAFEVASVKLMPPAIVRVVSRIGGDAGRLDCSNEQLKTLLAYAYNLRVSRISGPSWLDTERYSVVAKIPDGVPRSMVPAMLQELLIERLQMKVHREMKEEPIYALLVGKGGAKLEPAEVTSASGPIPGGSMKVVGDPSNGGSLLRFTEATMGTLANQLSGFVDPPVVDMTELNGAYNFVIEIPTYELPGMGSLRPGARGGATAAGDRQPMPDVSPTPSVFASIQKFGLRLEARRGPVEYLVIDHAERIPTEN